MNTTLAAGNVTALNATTVGPVAPGGAQSVAPVLAFALSCVALLGALLAVSLMRCRCSKNCCCCGNARLRHWWRTSCARIACQYAALKCYQACRGCPCCGRWGVALLESSARLKAAMETELEQANASSEEESDGEAGDWKRFEIAI